MSGDSSSKTEQPTPKKLRDARKKGQVAKSKEITSSAVIIGLFIYLWIFWDFILKNLKEMIHLPASYYDLPFKDAFPEVYYGVIIKIVIVLLPILIAAFILASMGFFLQFGVLFSFFVLNPDFNRLNPIQGFKKIFSLSNIIELIKSIIKVLFLGILMYIVIKDSLDPLVKIAPLGLTGILSILAAIFKKIVIYASAAFLIIATLDHFFQKFLHLKKLRMSKDEVKREYKEMEGDPVIKSKRKQLHRELAMNNNVQNTRKASVLVTNPTHLAVALFYDEKETKLPVVVAKGEDFVAKKMIEIAEEEGIPIMRNVPLAHSLYEEGEIDEYIPSELIQPVAEVLRWVRQMEQDRMM